VTERKLVYTWMLFSSAVLGSVFGGMGVFGILMAYCESLFEVFENRSQKREKIRNLENGRKVLRVNFQKKIELVKNNQNEKEAYHLTFEQPCENTPEYTIN